MRSTASLWVVAGLWLIAGPACGGGDSSPTDSVPVPVCGDGRHETGEECDDGNTLAGDGCDATCQFEPPPNCGDGNVDYLDGEECDDGNTLAGDGCDDTCHIEAPAGCGNGALDLAVGEECDDGNLAPGDGCSASCQFEPVGATCGNGTMETGEVCDDGNTVNGDGCNPTCNFANTTTTFVGTVGVTGSLDGVGMAALIGGPGVLAADANNLWLADITNRTVRRIEIATGVVTTIAGNGAVAAAYLDDPIGTNARFLGPEAITTDGTRIWVADRGRIRQIEVAAPHAVTTVAGAGPGMTYRDGNGLAAQFDDLRGVTYYAGRVYVLDANAGVLARFDPTTGDVSAIAGTPYTTGCPPTGMPMDGIGAAAVMCSPRYMASDNSGNLHVADTNGNTIRRFNTVTGHLGTFAGTGACGYVDAIGTAAAIHRPRGMTSDGTSLYWVEFNAHTIRQGAAATGSISTMIGTPAACTLTCSCSAPPAGSHMEGIGMAAQLDGPYSIAFHYPSSSLFFVDATNAVIRRIR